tara:strand:- start:4263 stop:4460 length:198 start_codon:yes stop_codon:yes gene_type:complete
MHNDTRIRVIRQMVRDDFAERFGKQPFVNGGNGFMNIIFGSGNPTLAVPLVGHEWYFLQRYPFVC